MYKKSTRKVENIPPDVIINITNDMSSTQSVTISNIDGTFWEILSKYITYYDILPSLAQVPTPAGLN